MSGPDRHAGGISLATLVIASAASATAALVVSRTWGTGTLIGAAVTPIIVAVVTELLRRPATRLPDLRPPPPPAPSPGPSTPEKPEVHIYRATPEVRQWRTAALTALAAFVIGVGLYVGLDRLAGGSGRLVPDRDRDRATPAQTETAAQPTITVVTQRTVTVSTVTVQQERTRTVTVPVPVPATQPRTAATAPTTTRETQTSTSGE